MDINGSRVKANIIITRREYITTNLSTTISIDR